MPLLLAGSESTTSTGRRYLIEGLPIFNDGGDFVLSDVEGWEDPAPPDAVLVANGGGAGVLASGAWLAKERALTVSGVITIPADDQAIFRRMILQGFPADRDAALVGYANGAGDVDLQMFVRRYDRPTFVRTPTFIEFTVPLVAADPYKYALTPLSGTCGVWTGEDWYLALTQPVSAWVLQLSLSGGTWGVQLAQDVPDGPYPTSITLDSAGDVASRRITASIAGPLTAGDWYLWSETTGRKLWVEAGVVEGQTLILDSRARSASLSGADVSHLTFGDWLTLEQGANTFRLVAGTDSTASCMFTALEAYE